MRSLVFGSRRHSLRLRFIAVVALARDFCPALGFTGVHRPLIREGVAADALDFAACAKTSAIVTTNYSDPGQRKCVKKAEEKQRTVVFAVMSGDFLSCGDVLENFEGDIPAFSDKFAVVLTVMLEMDISGYCVKESTTHINEPCRAKEEVVHTPTGGVDYTEVLTYSAFGTSSILECLILLVR